MTTERITCQAVVLGAGPGGYVAAIRLGQLGVNTVLVDAGTIGGTCLNIGCIPSKALIHEADAFGAVRAAAAAGRYGLVDAAPEVDLAAVTADVRKVVSRLTGGVTGLVKRAGVTTLTGRGEVIDGKTIAVTDADGAVTTVRAEHVVLATGSQPAVLPGLEPGSGNGSSKVITSTEALFLDDLPARLAVIGAGYIGLELGTAFAKLGSAVTVCELADRILPQYDDELTKPVARRLRQLGVTVRVGTSFTELGAPEFAEFDKVLVTVGRRPELSGFGVEALGLAMNGPFLAVDEHGHTSMRNVWAIGDVTGEPMLAHRAMAQGEVVAEQIAAACGIEAAADFSSLTAPVIPAVCYTDPEIVTVGLSPDAAAERGIDTIVGTANFAGNGRALTLGRTDGLVRVVARADNHAVVGLQAVGPEIAEFATTFVLALEMGCVLEDLAAAVPAHPTLGEALQEATFTALGRPLHS